MKNIEDSAITNLEPTCTISKRAQSSTEHIERLDISITIEDLTVVFEQDIALWDIDLEMRRGEHLVVLGQSGAGKTTLLKCLMGLVKPTAGNIYIYGKPAEKQKKMVSFIPHASAVNWEFPISLYDMVIMGTYSKIGWVLRPGPVSRHKTSDVLKKLEIYEIRNKQICDLSSIERQRALIARALAKEAEVFLMDEPLNGTDKRTETIFWELLSVLKDNGKTVVAAFNNPQIAAARFDLAYLINAKPVAFGQTASVLTEKNILRAFGGKTGFLEREDLEVQNHFQPGGLPQEDFNRSPDTVKQDEFQIAELPSENENSKTGAYSDTAMDKGAENN
jgi:manganese/zinc/iron transport system ATP- binding protein